MTIGKENMAENFNRRAEEPMAPRGDSRRISRVEKDWETTLAALKRILQDKSSIQRLGKGLCYEIDQAIKSAESELAEKGVLSETTAKSLDSLYAQARAGE